MGSRIVVSHLTKMSPGFICVAGTDVATGEHIRPLANRSLRMAHLSSAGGIFNIGEIVDLGKIRRTGTPPEVEDRLFREHELHSVGRALPDVFWAGISASAETHLQTIFGRELQPVGRSCATAAGEGRASLGYLSPTSIIDLRVVPRFDDFGVHDTLRMELQVNQRTFDVPVTDIRFCGLRTDGLGWVVYRDLVESVLERIRADVPLVLAVGLTRGFRRDGDSHPRHWLQVNNVHLADNPLWGLDSLLRDDASTQAQRRLREHAAVNEV